MCVFGLCVFRLDDGCEGNCRGNKCVCLVCVFSDLTTVVRETVEAINVCLVCVFSDLTTVVRETVGAINVCVWFVCIQT